MKPAIALVILTLFALVLSQQPQVAYAATGNITVTITHLTDVDNSADTTNGADFYADVTIGGQAAPRSARIDDNGDVEINPRTNPTWSFTRNVELTTTVAINIKVAEHDSPDGDDIGDISPLNDDVELSITYNAFTGTWVAEGGSSLGVIQGDGDEDFPEANDGYPVRINFSIATGGDFDTDDDGISDAVENNGVRKADGTLVRDLNSDPCRKSIVIWVDYMSGAANGHTHEPKADAISAVVAAFANSGEPAVTPCPYGTSPASGIEFIYIKGNALPEAAVMGLDGPFTAAKNASVAPELQAYVHYVAFVHDQVAGSSSSGLCCEAGKNFLVSLGSWNTGCIAAGKDGILQTTLGGDDVVTADNQGMTVGPDRNCNSTKAGDDIQIQAVGTGAANAEVGTVIQQAGTIMHELGHALLLEHGGNTPTNFKPNYFSVMNYAYQSNMFRGTDGAGNGIPTVDYSKVILPSLNKGGLNENVGTQGSVQDWYIWTDDKGTSRISQPSATGYLDWKWDGAAEGSVPVDINANDDVCILPGTNGTGETTKAGDDTNDSFPAILDGADGMCQSTPTGDDTGRDTVLTGFKDWDQIKYRGKDSINAGASPADHPTEPDVDYPTHVMLLIAYAESQPPEIEIKKDVKPDNAPGRFNLLLDGSIAGTGGNVGDNGTTGAVETTVGTATISESAVTGTDLGRYETKIRCDHRAGGLYKEGDGTSISLDLTGGEDIVCTITNRLPIPDECLGQTYTNFIFGDANDNTIKGTAARDVILGYGGKDQIDGLGNGDCIAGGPGNDTLIGNFGADIIAGDAGEDNINGGLDSDSIYGGTENDTIDGGVGHDTIRGGAGDDNILGGNGNDIIFGEVGLDTIHGGNDNDQIQGGDDNDNIQGSNGNDTIYGNGGTGDVINGGTGTDSCNGANGGAVSPGESVTFCESNAGPLPP